MHVPILKLATCVPISVPHQTKIPIFAIFSIENLLKQKQNCKKKNKNQNFWQQKQILFSKSKKIGRTKAKTKTNFRFLKQKFCFQTFVGNTGSDNNPKFRNEFFNFLAAISDFFFKVRSDATITTPELYKKDDHSDFCSSQLE